MSQHLSRVENLTNAHSIAIIYLHQNNGKTSGTSCRVKHREICPIERHHFDLKSDLPAAPDLFQWQRSELYWMNHAVPGNCMVHSVKFRALTLTWTSDKHDMDVNYQRASKMDLPTFNRIDICIYTLSVQTLRICRVWSETLGLPMMIVNTSCLHVKPRVSQHVLRILPSPGCQLGGAWLSSVSRHVGGTYLWYNIL